MNALWIEDVRSEILPMLRRLHEMQIAVTLIGQIAQARPLLVQESHWDLILLDSYFPGEEGAIHSGSKLFGDLRSGSFGDWGRMVPIVFVTGYAEHVQAVVDNSQSNGIGAAPPLGVLEKPADLMRFEQLIRQVRDLT
jgi:response regulator of citrate/malate metabolism